MQNKKTVDTHFLHILTLKHIATKFSFASNGGFQLLAKWTRFGEVKRCEGQPIGLHSLNHYNNLKCN